MECVAVPPRRHQGNVSICNKYRVIGPLDVTDQDIRSTFRRFVSICNSYELKQPLNVTDRDKPLSAHTTGISTPQPIQPAEEYPPASFSRLASPGL